MAIDIIPTTELEAVNMMLASIGESPIASLEDGFVDADLARDLLRQKSKAVQLQGWEFNTLHDYKFIPSISDNKIYLPINTLKFWIPGYRQYVRRGQHVYDNKNHTYEFERPLIGELVVGLPFDELSEALRQYLYMAAARVFQDQTAGDGTLHQITKEDETRAKANFWNEVAGQEQLNIVDQSPTVVGIKGRYRA